MSRFKAEESFTKLNSVEEFPVQLSQFLKISKPLKQNLPSSQIILLMRPRRIKREASATDIKGCLSSQRFLL